MKLIIIHHHFRPGGVRRVLELATPHVVRALRPAVGEVLVAGCDTPEASWWRQFCRQLEPLPVALSTQTEVGYLSEQGNSPALIATRLQAWFSELLDGTVPGECLVWAHNQGLGRNLVLTRELEQACTARKIPLVLHHHDWWFDNRWRRWPEMRRHGFQSLAEVAKVVLSTSSNTRHIAINLTDATVLRRHLPQQCGWLPNPASVCAPVSHKETRRAREWLQRQIGHEAPVWLMPCRLLRRKNVAEALLLTRWLRPDAWLVTTAGVTSADEVPYAERLKAAALRHRWPLRLSVLDGKLEQGPTVPELLAASEVVLLTSLHEGFGLSYIEAAIARRPLISRSLPNVAPDLANWGLRFPQSYDELLVDPALFDLGAEVTRQRRLFRQFLNELPPGVRRWAGRPILFASDPQDAVPFSRLTLTAQLEVLAQPTAISWTACVALNHWLREWQQRAACGALKITPWLPKAQRCLSGRSFAKGFVEILRTTPSVKPPAASSVAAQQEFIRAKLQPDNLYPLTWSSET